jgi:hypothetical protein
LTRQYESSTSTGTTRPYFSTTVGAPLLVGEENTWQHYAPGKKGRDPFLDCERKMVWDSWDRLYGNIPYIFAYGAIEGINRKQYEQNKSLMFTFGILLRSDQKFHKL